MEQDLSALSGLDRYQGVAWQIIGPPGHETLLVRAREKPYAPPFMMLGISLENTTSNAFRTQFAGRYLAFDVLGSGAELRIEGVARVRSLRSGSPVPAALQDQGLHSPLRRRG